MKSLLIALGRLLLGIARGFQDPDFRAILFLLSLAILGGTVFYRYETGWTWIDALYFSVMTLATIGDARLAPTTDFAKLFTIVYAIGGVGLMLAFVTRLATHMLPDRGQRGSEK